MANLSEIENQEFDVIIVGGGIIGAGIARDAALRGLNVALFEQNDFGSGTTSGSTRLIHGGLRYLEQLDFKLVKMDLTERAILLKIAPHLVKPLPFILPFYDSNFFTRTKFKIGLSMYDSFAGKDNLEKYQTLSSQQINELEPFLSQEKLDGGLMFYDAQVNMPERLCLENILDAEILGAKVFNYTKVVNVICDSDKITGVIVEAKENEKRASVKSKIVVNASGAWFNRLAGVLDDAATEKIRLTKGVHIACPPTLQKHAVIFNSPIDGRTMFVIPWMNMTWIGTTDTDFADDPANAVATNEDIKYLHDSAKKIIPDLSDEIYFTTAGVRALVKAKGSESSVSRMHKVESPKTGLVNVLGGKITGFRAIAQDATDLICEKLGVKQDCQTANRSLIGKREQMNFDSENYTDLEAQVEFSVKNEHCKTAEDFIFRRTNIAFTADRSKGRIEKINQTFRK